MTFLSTHNNWRFVRPWKRPAGSSVILLPYRTLQQNVFLFIVVKWNRILYKMYPVRKKYTYRDSRDFKPWKASAATFFIWLLLRSLRVKSRKHRNIKWWGRCARAIYVLEKVNYEYHSHSSQFSVWWESFGWNFRNTILFQTPAGNYGKTNYINKLANLYIMLVISSQSSEIIDRFLLVHVLVLFCVSLLPLSTHIRKYMIPFCILLILIDFIKLFVIVNFTQN